MFLIFLVRTEALFSVGQFSSWVVQGLILTNHARNYRDVGKYDRGKPKK